MIRTRLILIGAASLITILFIYIIWTFFFAKPSNPLSNINGTLRIWGVFDDRNDFNAALGQFKKEFRNLKVSYELKNSTTYHSDLINALAAGQGPDIFMIHNDWLFSDADKIMPIATTSYSINQLRIDYPEIIEKEFTRNEQVYALPVFIDTLALFWNRDIFNAAGVATPPKTWSDLLKLTPKFTRFDSRGKIIQSAVALGTARNIDRSEDIYSLIALQFGERFTAISQDLNRISGQAIFGQSDSSANKALLFYTQFANSRSPYYNWNQTTHYSIDNFAEGTSAMLFTYAYNIDNIKSKNSKLNFAIAPMPQVSLSSQPINYPNYWGFAISKASKFPRQVLERLMYNLASKNSLSDYLQKTGRPAPRRDLIEAQYNDPLLNVFARQTLTAQNWIKPNAQQTDIIIRAMIDNVFSGHETVNNALRNAQDRINQLFNQ